MPDININTDVPPDSIFTRRIEQKFYELTDHLGNVRATLSDRKLPATTGINTGPYHADIRSYNHPYPFGMPQPGRSWDSVLYRYGFNGMETDPEIKEGRDQHYTTFFRQYDPRLGRWWSHDPVTQMGESPYAAMFNNPVLFSDPMGSNPTGDDKKKKGDDAEDVGKGLLGLLSGIKNITRSPEKSGGSGTDNSSRTIWDQALDESFGTGVTPSKTGPVISPSTRPPAAITQAPADAFAPNAATLFREHVELQIAYGLSPEIRNTALISWVGYQTLNGLYSAGSWVWNKSSSIVSPPATDTEWLAYPSNVGYNLEGKELSHSELREAKLTAALTLGGPALKVISTSAGVLVQARTANILLVEAQAASKAVQATVLSAESAGAGQSAAIPSGVPASGPGYSSFGDDILGQVAARNPKRAWYDIILHGTEDGTGFVANGQKMSAQELHNAILQNGYQQGTRIRLMSCHSGAIENGAAQQLSNLTGGQVVAPTHLTYNLYSQWRVSNQGIFRLFLPK